MKRIIQRKKPSVTLQVVLGYVREYCRNQDMSEDSMNIAIMAVEMILGGAKQRDLEQQ